MIPTGAHVRALPRRLSILYISLSEMRFGFPSSFFFHVGLTFTLLDPETVSPSDRAISVIMQGMEHIHNHDTEARATKRLGMD